MIELVLLVAAFIVFVLAVFGVPSRVNLVAVGLALWVLAVLVGGWPPDSTGL